ncbi:MAG: hypothetical protein KIG51_02740 [Fibrobacter sp.]|nr:hypothetical protein [Fibrobacter sp.]
MHKISLAVSSMIVTGFLMKSYKKLREKPEPELDELHRRMRAPYEEHLKIERRRAAARKTFARMDVISTPRDGGLMSSIDSLQQMAPERFM